MADFLTTGEEQQVVEAIREAESRTSGEIRVVITARRALWPERYAWKLFDRLGMRQTKHRNGALIVVFDRRKRFVVLGDAGINEKVDPAFWSRITDTMSQRLRDGQRVEALTATVNALGDVLSTHWPPEVVNPDELPNRIHRD